MRTDRSVRQALYRFFVSPAFHYYKVVAGGIEFQLYCRKIFLCAKRLCDIAAMSLVHLQHSPKYD